MFRSLCLDVELAAQADEATAYKWLQDELARVRAGVDLAQRPKLRFADYATSLLERKIQTGDIRSPKGQERWRYKLEHLIAGTSLPEEQIVVMYRTDPADCIQRSVARPVLRASR